MRHPLEGLLGAALRAVILLGVPVSATSLIFPAPSGEAQLFWYVVAQLTVIQIGVFVWVIRVAPAADEDWFNQAPRPWLARVASITALAVGVAALVTLAAGAASRYQPSMQFLQLLSSLDIAWVVAALYLGGRAMWKRPVALTAASLLLVACVVSIAVYLARVGFAPDGGWIVDGSEMLRVVIPSDVAAAVMSISTVLLASRRIDVDQPTAHPRAQS